MSDPFPTPEEAAGLQVRGCRGAGVGQEPLQPHLAGAGAGKQVEQNLECRNIFYSFSELLPTKPVYYKVFHINTVSNFNFLLLSKHF